jgi:hypothetical protein
MSYFTFAMATGGGILLLIGIFVAVYAILWITKDQKQNNVEKYTKNQITPMKLLKTTDIIHHINFVAVVTLTFRYYSIYYRAIVQVIKLTLVIVLIAGFHNIKGQATAVTILLFLYALLFIIIRPFRLLYDNQCQFNHLNNSSVIYTIITE